MNTPLYIAKRYLFSKKSHNIVNIISGISVFGIFISTAAMVIVLSAFNGIEGLVQDLYSSFDPDVKVTLKEGKTFTMSKDELYRIKSIEGIMSVSTTIDETVLIKNGENWVTATMKGIDDNFLNQSIPDSILTEGFATVKEGGVEYAILGYGVRSMLQVSSNPQYNNTITIYGLNRNEKITKNNSSAFNSHLISVGGIFSINPDFDNKYILVPISFANSILGYSGEITALEIDVKPSADVNHVRDELKKVLGDQFDVKTRYEQNELIFKTNETEKWMVFLILGFILLLSTFNIIASLTMLILDKEKDIRTLSSIGASKHFLKKVFLYEGLLINSFGVLLGLSVGLLITVLQINFHLIKMTNSVVDFWPMIINPFDVGLILIAVLIIGFTSSYIPPRILLRKLEEKKNSR